MIMHYLMEDGVNPSLQGHTEFAKTTLRCSRALNLSYSLFSDIIVFVSSVRSSNSHPDLLVIQHPTLFRHPLPGWQIDGVQGNALVFFSCTRQQRAVRH